MVAGETPAPSQTKPPQTNSDKEVKDKANEDQVDISLLQNETPIDRARRLGYVLSSFRTKDAVAGFRKTKFPVLKRPVIPNSRRFRSESSPLGASDRTGISCLRLQFEKTSLTFRAIFGAAAIMEKVRN